MVCSSSEQLVNFPAVYHSAFFILPLQTPCNAMICPSAFARSNFRAKLLNTSAFCSTFLVAGNLVVVRLVLGNLVEENHRNRQEVLLVISTFSSKYDIACTYLHVLENLEEVHQRNHLQMAGLQAQQVPRISQHYAQSMTFIFPTYRQPNSTSSSSRSGDSRPSSQTSSNSSWCTCAQPA